MSKLLTIKFESKEEAQKWCKLLSAHINDHSRWKRAAEVIQRVSNIESTRNSFISNKRQGSLYDETPLIGKSANYCKHYQYILQITKRDKQFLQTKITIC